MSRSFRCQLGGHTPAFRIKFLHRWLHELIGLVWRVLVIYALSMPVAAHAQTSVMPMDGKVLSALAFQAWEKGQYAEAAAKMELARAAFTQQLGPDHPETLNSMRGLAYNYSALGRLAEALKLHEETLALMRSKLGPEHPATLDSMSGGYSGPT